jgi:hypothetical protein
MALLFLLVSDLGAVVVVVVVLVVTVGALFCDGAVVVVGLLMGLATWTCEDTGATICFF